MTVTACPDHNKIVAHAYKQGEASDICLIISPGFQTRRVIFACGAADLVLIPATLARVRD